MEKTSEEGQRLHELKMSYMHAARKQLEAHQAWLRALAEIEVPDSEWDDYYEITETKRRPNLRLIGRTLMEARGFAAHLLHPPNGYLLPLAVLLTAMPLGVIAFHYQREAFIRFTCAGGRGQELLRIEKALGMKDIEGISSDSRIDHLCDKY